jgi:hypothetical protein
MKNDNMKKMSIEKNYSKKIISIHCSYIDMFNELIRIPKIISQANFTIEIILVQIEEIRVRSKSFSYRRKGWNIYDKK